MPAICPKCQKRFAGHSIGTHAAKCGLSSSAHFWSKVNKGDGCWLWAGAKHVRGYGACCKGYGDTRAHRVSWLITHGPVPKGQGVLHKCDTPLCVNPDHLYLGDQKQNACDRDARGRAGGSHKPLDQLLHPQLSKRLKQISAANHGRP